MENIYNNGQTTEDNSVYWHLPGFCKFFQLNQMICSYMKNRPEMFRDGYRIGSVYGTFPGAIWNGGRAVFGIAAKAQIEQILRVFNDMDVPVRFTWTNSLIEEKHVNDTYCNLIMKLADNGKNQVLVNTRVLEDYIREHYPNFDYISSTTKRITNLDEIRSELEKGYRLVVLDYDLNHNEEVLKALEPEASRIEILVDEICYPNCPLRKNHYRDESKAQLEYDTNGVFRCPNTKTKPSFAESMKRPAFIGNDSIDSYIKRGYRNFKLVGRGLPQEMVLDSYMYYLVKDRYRDELKAKLIKALAGIQVTG